MSLHAAERKPKRERRPAWVKATKLVDPLTGEEKSCFVAAHWTDADEIRARGIKIGDVLRADFRKRRNPKFFRLAHALARHVAENVDGFEVEVASRDWHRVLKRLQREAGVACEEQEIDIPEVGKLIAKVALSLNFDEMDETEFADVFRGLTFHVAQRYFPDMTPEQIDEAARMIAGEH